MWVSMRTHSEAAAEALQKSTKSVAFRIPSEISSTKRSPHSISARSNPQAVRYQSAVHSLNELSVG